MPWPIPFASAIAERIAGSLEQAIARLRPEIDPVALSRSVRSSRGMLAQVGRATALELRETHDHVSWWARQYFPDTAEDEFAERHASIWGVDHRGATAATGIVLVEGAVGAPVPGGVEFSGSDGSVYTVDQLGVIGAGGSVALAVTAAVAGPAANLEAGIRLRTVLPFPEISRITVLAPGLLGGAAEETDRELAAATIARIRQRAHGGASFDYPFWLGRQFDVRAVRVVPDWIGRGSVGVVVIMKEGAFGRAPTPTEIDAMQIYLGRPGVAEGVRPVTAHVVVVAGTVRAVPLTVRLRPDTVATRSAVTDAWERFVATIGDADDARNLGPIGALIEPSRVSEAISAASGEYAHDLLVPAAPLQLERTEYPVPAAITFAAAP